MTGIYHHSIDAKGRVIIPSRLRDELGKDFHVTISLDNCLAAYSDESWQRFIEKVKGMSRVKQIRVRPFFSNAAKCELDTQGRILIPQSLRDRVGLKKNIAIVGAGDCVEFWDSEEWLEVDAKETTSENLMKVFEELDF